jgi:hypothetical protein
MGPIYVDANGVAHDDENNSWYVGMPEGHYNLRDLPRPPAEQRPPVPKKTVETSEEEKQFLRKALLAAIAKGDRKGAEFLHKMETQRALSEKQIAYRDAILNRHKLLAQRFPYLLFLIWNDISSLELPKPLTLEEQRKLEGFFLIRENERGKTELLSYKLNPTLKVGPSPTQTKQIAALDHLLSKKDIGFLKTIRYQLEDGSSLSPRQMEVVRKIFRENGEPEPEEFRTASLRGATIRLAYENPDLRETLLPLLKR